MLFVTYVNRNETVSNSGGLLLVDEVYGRIVAEVPAPPPAFLDDYNLLFHGKRGLSNMLYLDGLLYVAAFDSILVLDSALRLVRRITHPWFNALHGMAVSEEKGLWLTSTGLDLILRIDMEGNIDEAHFLGEEPALVEMPRYINRNVDLRRPVFPRTVLHPNYISVIEGEVYISLCNKGDLWALRSRRLVFKSIGVDSWGKLHDCRLYRQGERIIVYGNEADRNRFHRLVMSNDIVLDHCIVDLSDFGDQDLMNPVSRGLKGWLRGMYIRSDGEIFLGQAIAKIVEISLERDKPPRSIPLEKGQTSSVVDILGVNDPTFMREIEREYS